MKNKHNLCHKCGHNRFKTLTKGLVWACRKCKWQTNEPIKKPEIEPKIEPENMVITAVIHNFEPVKFPSWWQEVWKWLKGLFRIK